MGWRKWSRSLTCSARFSPTIRHRLAEWKWREPWERWQTEELKNWAWADDRKVYFKQLRGKKVSSNLWGEVSKSRVPMAGKISLKCSSAYANFSSDGDYGYITRETSVVSQRVLWQTLVQKRHPERWKELRILNKIEEVACVMEDKAHQELNVERKKQSSSKRGSLEDHLKSSKSHL